MWRKGLLFVGKSEIILVGSWKGWKREVERALKDRKAEETSEPGSRSGKF